MTMQEFRDLMDNFLPRISKYSRSISADSKLTDAEINVLYRFVDDFNDKKEAFDWDIRLKDIADIVYNYQPDDTNVAVVKNNANAVKIPKSFAMPFLVRQVLLYIAVACHKYKNNDKSLATQEAILKKLTYYKNLNPQFVNKLDLSHNFYSKMRVTDFINTVYYTQPELLFLYPGQKDENLGVALKHLVYQAGAYNLFIDLFGGSGAASVAFPRRNNSVYLYNDLDEDLANLIDVLSNDEDYLVLIEYMQRLKDDLKNENNVWKAFDFDFDEEVEKFVAAKDGQDTENERRIWFDLIADSSNKVDVEIITGLMYELYEDVSNDPNQTDFTQKVFDKWLASKKNYILLVLAYFEHYTDIVDLLEKNKIYSEKYDIATIVHTFSECKEEEIVFITDFMKGLYKNVSNDPAQKEFIKKVFADWVSFDKPVTLVDSFFEFSNEIVDLLKTNTYCNKYTQDEKDEVIRILNKYQEFLGMIEHKKRSNQLRFYEWYATFSNVLNDKVSYGVNINNVEDRTFLALAKIFLMQFTTSGQAGLSSVYRIYTLKGRPSKEWKKFLETDFEKRITRLHEILRKNDKALTNRIHKNTRGANRTLKTRTIIEVMSCIDLLDAYKYRTAEEWKNASNTVKARWKNKDWKNLLIYSDSPYIATRGYKTRTSKSNDVKVNQSASALPKEITFKADDMKALLEKLLEVDSKFIFSCRACAPVKGPSYDPWDIRKKNQSIWDDLFGQIETIFKDKQLYVLTIGKKDASFWDIVRNNKVAEIMITNYEIYGFTDDICPDVVYKTYPFAKFKDLLAQYMNELVIEG